MGCGTPSYRLKRTSSGSINGTIFILLGCNDETGKQQATSRTITRTGSDTVIDWSGDFDLQKAKVIRLKFEFAKAKLYSFIFGN